MVGRADGLAKNGELTPATASDTGGDTQPKEDAEMYCDDLRFHFKPKP